ncbi:Uncharacterised protein [Enterobacter cloacae]|nr:Uncharacterised protein [Enterobacter cloacae]
MTRAITGQLNRVFGGFHQGDGVGPPDNLSPGFDGKAQGDRRGIGINHHPFSCSNLLAAFDKGVLRRNAKRIAHVFRQGAELAVVNKPLNVAVTAQKSKRERYRAVRDIRATDV